MKQENKVKRSIFGVGNYLVYFLASALVVTVIVLIVAKPQQNENVSALRQRAILAFVVMLALTLILTLINGIWRRYTIGRPVKRILTATEKLTQGNFNVRIEPFHGYDSINELDAIIANFNIMAAELGSVEAIQTDFISSVSHELKTPLAVIQNYATMLQDPELSVQDRQQYALRITSATQKLSVLITNILKLNKLENQQITPKHDTFLLNEQLAEVLIGFEALWEQKELEIDTDMDDILITSDREMLELVWNNIISNAIKFSQPKGKIAIKITEIDTKSLAVAITDNGIGMSEKVSRHIFDKFYQGDTAHAGQGNGLGLALVKRVVDLLGGTISVITDLGTTFIIKLPKG